MRQLSQPSLVLDAAFDKVNARYNAFVLVDSSLLFKCCRLAQLSYLVAIVLNESDEVLCRTLAFVVRRSNNSSKKLYAATITWHTS